VPHVNCLSATPHRVLQKGLFNLQSILGYLSITVVYELIALWVVLNSLPLSFFVFVFSINRLLVLLRDFEVYDLRSFLQKTLN
jgi:hypothetical protein